MAAITGAGRATARWQYGACSRTAASTSPSATVARLSSRNPIAREARPTVFGVRPDGSILVGDTSDVPVFAVLTPAGTIDTTFDAATAKGQREMGVSGSHACRMAACFWSVWPTCATVGPRRSVGYADPEVADRWASGHQLRRRERSGNPQSECGCQHPNRPGGEECPELHCPQTAPNFTCRRSSSSRPGARILLPRSRSHECLRCAG